MVACAPAIGWRGRRPIDGSLYVAKGSTVLIVRGRGSLESPHLCFQGSSSLHAFLDGERMTRLQRGGMASDGVTGSGLPVSSCVSSRYELPGPTPSSFVVELRDGDTVHGRIRVKQGRRQTCGGFGRCAVSHHPPSFLER